MSYIIDSKGNIHFVKSTESVVAKAKEVREKEKDSK